MAAYNPAARLLRRQIESIKAQTFTNWSCVVTVDADDHGVVGKTIGRDSRFKVVRNHKRLGFYRNFEKALSLAPPADFIVLSDQDDRWDADKLESLLSAFTDDTQLVYSDCRLVSEVGEILSPTFWHNRGNNFTNLSCLVTANTVTGAASMFRASLLPQILPFPEDICDTYHDHWIAIVAAANGSLGYVDRPLYDYIQHGNNVIGHNYSAKFPGIFLYGREVAKGLRHRSLAPLREVTRQGVVQHAHVHRVALLARTALERSNCRNPKKRRILSRLSRYDTGIVVPLAEKVRALIDRRPSLNVEGNLLFAAIAMRAHRWNLVSLAEPPVQERASLPEFDPLAHQTLFFAHPLDDD